MKNLLKIWAPGVFVSIRPFNHGAALLSDADETL